MQQHGGVAVVQEVGGYDDGVAVDVAGGDELAEVGARQHALPLVAGRLVPGMDQHGAILPDVRQPKRLETFTNVS